MNRKNVAVLFGGCSSEYEVSLQSAYSIIGAINRDKYEVILIGITREGAWRRYRGELERLLDDTWYDDNLPVAVISPSRPGCLLELTDGGALQTPLDVIFPVLHGKNGEDGTVQGLGELAGIPVVGSGSAASALCMDKHRAHLLVSLAGIKVPEAISFERPSGAYKLGMIGQGGYPLFVKPVKAGSSLGITKVYTEDELMPAIDAAFMFDDAVIIEETIDGFEVGCAVVGNDTLITGRPDEIELSGGFFNFMEKYSLKTSKIHMPARVDTDTERRICDSAQIIYRTLGCRGYARVDMFLQPDGEIVFNEVNTIPGFTSHSRFPNMMKGAGVEFAELVERLIVLAIEPENTQ